MNVRLLLAEDHVMLRDLLAQRLEVEPGLEVVAEVDNGRDAVRLVEQKRPTVALMDIDMPDLNGIEATRQIVKRFPSVKVICLSQHSDRRSVMQMFSAGASGYIPKKCALDELVQAIKTVADNKVHVSPLIADMVIGHFISQAPADEQPIITALSPREREVLQLIAEGSNTKEIAFKINVSVKTVESHRKNIMSKLGIFSVAELTKFAVREGLTTLD